MLNFAKMLQTCYNQRKIRQKIFSGSHLTPDRAPEPYPPPPFARCVCVPMCYVRITLVIASFQAIFTRLRCAKMLPTYLMR